MSMSVDQISKTWQSGLGLSGLPGVPGQSTFTSRALALVECFEHLGNYKKGSASLGAPESTMPHEGFHAEIPF